MEINIYFKENTLIFFIISYVSKSTFIFSKYQNVKLLPHDLQE